MDNILAKILLVDDEKEICDSIANYFTEFEILIANNGKEGLELLQTKSFDLIGTDIIMPEMEGVEFVQKVRRTDKKIPIIAMSGHKIGKEFLKTIKLLGGIKNLAKPFKVEELRSLIAEILEI